MSIASALMVAARLACRGAAVLAGACLILMMAQTVLDVVLTGAFNAPMEGNLEIVSYYYMVAVVFLPLGLVELGHEHINVDLLVARLRPVARNRVYVLAGLLAAGFVAMLLAATLADAVEATAIGEMIMGATLVHVWPAKWALPIGFGALLLAIGANVAAALRDVRGFDPRPGGPAGPGAD